MTHVRPSQSEQLVYLMNDSQSVSLVFCQFAVWASDCVARITMRAYLPTTVRSFATLCRICSVQRSLSRQALLTLFVVFSLARSTLHSRRRQSATSEQIAVSVERRCAVDIIGKDTRTHQESYGYGSCANRKPQLPLTPKIGVTKLPIQVTAKRWHIEQHFELISRCEVIVVVNVPKY